MSQLLRAARLSVHASRASTVMALNMKAMLCGDCSEALRLKLTCHLQEERITMLELRHNPWCEGLDCVDSLEEPLEGDLEGDLDLGGTPLEGAASQNDTISSSLQLVLPSDFGPSRVNSKSAVITSPAGLTTCPSSA